ncbi:hypothetical protein F5H01DRAFT_326200 [Linnemannia elongata]|nr:hypothetical protein F5H01DRAFT_326200 [Linnemannia elongata]
MADGWSLVTVAKYVDLKRIAAVAPSSQRVTEKSWCSKKGGLVSEHQARQAYNHHRVVHLPLQADLPPAPLPATVTSFPALLVDQTPPSPPPLPPTHEGGDVHFQAQLYAVQLQLQALVINVAKQDYSA